MQNRILLGFYFANLAKCYIIRKRPTPCQSESLALLQRLFSLFIRAEPAVTIKMLRLKLE